MNKPFMVKQLQALQDHLYDANKILGTVVASRDTLKRLSVVADFLDKADQQLSKILEDDTWRS